MRRIFVVESLKDWPIKIDGIEIMIAKDYLGNSAEVIEGGAARVFNLCRSYRYQSIGYYVSLLAEARGHKPAPSVSAILDMKARTVIKMASESLDELIQRSLSPIRSDEFPISLYFGRNMALRYDKLCRELDRIYHVPLMRAYFQKNGKWQLKRLQPIGLKDVPDSHLPFIMSAATEYFKKRGGQSIVKDSRFSLAILVCEEEALPPSNKRAIKKFIKAANANSISVELICKDDFHRLAEFDALFVRETTNVNHHTYRFAQKAKALGLVVIDDPLSILRCTNKVYLRELLESHGIAQPKSQIITRSNFEKHSEQFEYPIILKIPDGSFSQGVIKINDKQDFLVNCREMLEQSELLLAQEYLPTDFDWRVGVLGGKVLFVCKYFMAKQHWQIYNRSSSGEVDSGNFECVAIENAPADLIQLSLKVSRKIGDGLYGLDIKQVGGRYLVIEVNDNPNIDAGVEDQKSKDDVYKLVMDEFLNRLVAKARGKVKNGR